MKTNLNIRALTLTLGVGLSYGLLLYFLLDDLIFENRLHWIFDFLLLVAPGVTIQVLLWKRFQRKVSNLMTGFFTALSFLIMFYTSLLMYYLDTKAMLRGEDLLVVLLVGVAYFFVGFLMTWLLRNRPQKVDVSSEELLDDWVE